MAITSITTPSNSKAVGRIVGWTVNMVKFEADETPIVERGLAGNLANANMLINGKTITSEDKTSVNGGDLNFA